MSMESTQAATAAGTDGHGTHVRAVTDASFAADVLGSDLPVLVDFWTDWCPPCKRLAPIVEQLAEEYAGRVRIVSMDAEAEPNTARDLAVMAFPTLAVFSGGELVRRIVGLQPKRTLSRLLDEVS